MQYTTFPTHIKHILQATPLHTQEDKWTTLHPFTQINTSDCGVFVCLFAHIYLQHSTPALLLNNTNPNTMSAMGNPMRSIILYTILTNHSPNIFTYTLQNIQQKIFQITESVTDLQQRINTLQNTVQSIQKPSPLPNNQPYISEHSLSYLQALITNTKNTIQQATKQNQMTNQYLNTNTKPSDHHPTHHNHTQHSSYNEATTEHTTPPKDPHTKKHKSTHTNTGHLQLLGLPTTPKIYNTLPLHNIPQSLCARIPGLSLEHQTRLYMAEKSLPPQTEFPLYPWKPGPHSSTAISTTFFDAGFYTPLTTTQLPNIPTPNTACPLCHRDFTKFRSAFACKLFDPTPAYPPTTLCIIPATELLNHLQLISKIHPPHKYLLNFIYLRHPQTAPKGWHIHKIITPRGITKAHI